MQLTLADIQKTAVELLDSYGLGDMTMRRIATTLGVAPGALYWHVANKQALIAQIADSFIANVSGNTPQDVVLSLRDQLLAHRDGAELVTAAISQPDSRGWQELNTKFLSALHDVDIEPTAAVVGAQTLIHLTLGATVVEQSRSQFAALFAQTNANASEQTSDASEEENQEVDNTQQVALSPQEMIIAGTSAVLKGLPKVRQD
ncbi:MAG: TetR family transcriptional regulator [Corynebacterium sp.]|nr:TetR family transcriptional regulator [Corynebacterium sp.]